MKRFVAAILDVLLLPATLASGVLLKLVRRIGFRNLPRNRGLLLKVGVIPVRDHYYEPFYRASALSRLASEPRPIGGIDWNIEGQLELLKDFVYAGELQSLPARSDDPTVYCLENNTFASGDAEFWYQMVRAQKPSRIIEIGSGNSTLVARLAISENEKERPDYSCEHICVEPFEMPWLEQVGVKVVRSKVEDLGFEFFDDLKGGDVLFIDSSHVIRPEGDVLFEYLELLPRLNSGVIVHVHDIFSPRNYLQEWLSQDVQFWNEQYLLEAFLAFNGAYEVLAGVNMLKNDHYDRLKAVCPHLTRDREPGSFYMRRI